MYVEKNAGEPMTKNQTTIERTSDTELVITRAFNGPVEFVFDAWTKPELVKRWWAPRNYGIELVSCEIDLRVGGQYRYTFAVEGKDPMHFYGTYLEVLRPTRLVWTNADASDYVSTATFLEQAGKTVLTLHERHPSKAALDEAFVSGSYDGVPLFEQLDELIVSAAKLG